MDVNFLCGRLCATFRNLCKVLKKSSMIYKTWNGYKISDGSAALVPLKITSKKFKAELLLQDSYIIYLFNSLNI